MDARTQKAKEKYEGKIFPTVDGKKDFIVNKFNSGSDIEIEFLGSDLIRHVSSYDMNKGIKNPFANSCVFFEDSEKELLGNHYQTNEGYYVVVIAVKSKKEVTVKFLDEYGYEFITTIQNIRKGEVKNPFHKNKFGGYIGVGLYYGNDYKWLYRIWYNMLIRANAPEYYLNYHGSNTISYDNTIIDQRWLCYNEFANWYMYSISKLNPNYQYEMDKDLFYRFYRNRTNNYKCYGPDTVALMPHDLNAALQGFSNPDKFSSNFVMYELKRNEPLIEKAEFYYKENVIDERTYRCIVDSFKPKS